MFTFSEQTFNPHYLHGFQTLRVPAHLCISTPTMSTTAKILVKRNDSVIDHKSFYNLLNGCAEKHGLTGRTTFNEQGSYVFRLAGPPRAIQDFAGFMQYLDGTAGNVVLIELEDAVVPQASNYFPPQTPETGPNRPPDTEDAVVPVFPSDEM